MSRPIYERPDDRKREAEAVAMLVSHLKSEGYAKVEANEAPRLHPFDYEIVIDGKPRMIVEVKCRNNNRDAYPNYMISESKLRVLREEAHKRGLTGMLLVKWSDCIGLADASAATARGIRAFGGRYDRNDPADHEAVIHIPHSVFAMLGGPA